MRLGAQARGGLRLGGLWSSQPGASRPERAKSLIMVYLPGGPSHIDMYDLKPDIPAEYPGEFKPIPTTVRGIDVCEFRFFGRW